MMLCVTKHTRKISLSLEVETRTARTGPPLPETLRLLAPLASTLEKLDLSLNKLGGTITDDIAAFTKLNELGLHDMGLEGAWYDQTYRARKRIEKRIAQASSRSSSSA